MCSHPIPSEAPLHLSMFPRYVTFACILPLASACALSRSAQLITQNDSGWHQHYDGVPLQAATPLVSAPLLNDPHPIRISGVWRNRANYNLWQHKKGASMATASCLVHGYVGERTVSNVPRFKFAGTAWNTNPQAMQARELIIRAFAEWSALQAGSNTATGEELATGLEFRLVPPDSAAEIQIGWRNQRTAATTDRTLSANGQVTRTTLWFNARNDWAFGPAATTRPNQMHFYSTALHEIGHIVGLWESRDRTSVMIYSRTPGPNGPSFDRLDDATRRAAYALYSFPSSEADAPTESCTP
jgi:Matrixin